MPLSKYQSNLYDVAEKLKAKAILEVGLGWCESGEAFCESLSNRKPASLLSIDIATEENVPLLVGLSHRFKLRGVTWSVLRGDAMIVPVTGTFDLLYLDGPCSKEGFERCWANLGSHLRKGGTLVVDGYGEHMVRQGHPGANDFVKEMQAKGFTFKVSEYAKDCAHAITTV
jgi:predicted O-methyltransferase YrrM